jgi:MFS transporter, DHA2 family, multidrug resistance protein
MTSVKSEDLDPLQGARRYTALLAILLAVAASVIDATAMNVVLPFVAADFAIDASDAIGVVSAHQIAMVALLLPCASLAEKIGYRRMLRIGLVLFVVASAYCFVAGSFLELLIGRIAVGLSGSCMFSSTTALVRLSQPTRALGRTMGTVATVVAVSTGIGPVIGTAIVGFTGWFWIFLPNVIAGIAALLMTGSLPAIRDAGRKVNFLSGFLAAVALSSLVTAIAGIEESAAYALLFGSMAVVTGTWLWRREREVAFPVLPVDLLKIRQFSIAIGGAACLFLAQMSAFVALPFHLHQRFDHVTTGLLLTAWPAAVALTAPWAGYFSDRLPSNVLCAIGALLLTVGLIASSLFAGSDLVPAVCALFVSGIGFGLFQTPNNRSMLLAVPLTRVGAAGGMQAATRHLGQALGASIAGLMFSLSPAAGSTLSLSLAACVACLALIVSLLPARTQSEAA